MTVIDLTPTRAEHARIIAYIMSSHVRGYSFGKDYWNYTDAEENAIFDTWRRLELIEEQYKFAGMEFWHDTPEPHKAKLIKAMHTEALKEQLDVLA
jgi:hypothetical protein